MSANIFNIPQTMMLSTTSNNHHPHHHLNINHLHNNRHNLTANGRMESINANQQSSSIALTPPPSTLFSAATQSYSRTSPIMTAFPFPPSLPSQCSQSPPGYLSSSGCSSTSSASSASSTSAPIHLHHHSKSWIPSKLTSDNNNNELIPTTPTPLDSYQSESLKSIKKIDLTTTPSSAFKSIQSKEFNVEKFDKQIEIPGKLSQSQFGAINNNGNSSTFIKCTNNRNNSKSINSEWSNPSPSAFTYAHYTHHLMPSIYHSYYQHRSSEANSPFMLSSQLNDSSAKMSASSDDVKISSSRIENQIIDLTRKCDENKADQNKSNDTTVVSGSSSANAPPSQLPLSQSLKRKNSELLKSQINEPNVSTNTAASASRKHRSLIKPPNINTSSIYRMNHHHQHPLPSSPLPLPVTSNYCYNLDYHIPLSAPPIPLSHYNQQQPTNNHPHTPTTFEFPSPDTNRNANKIRNNTKLSKSSSSSILVKNDHSNNVDNKQQHQEHSNKGSQNKSTTSEFPNYFRKGSTIKLNNGNLKKIEDLITKDFIECATNNDRFCIELAELIAIKDNSTRLLLLIGAQRSKVSMNTTIDHPFFVYQKGWCSLSPSNTFKHYGLNCHRLLVGDIVITLTNKINHKSNNHHYNSMTPSTITPNSTISSNNHNVLPHTPSSVHISESKNAKSASNIENSTRKVDDDTDDLIDVENIDDDDDDDNGIKQGKNLNSK